MADFYQLLYMRDGKGVLTIFTETHEDAEQLGKRMVEAERKQGIDATIGILHVPNVPEEWKKTFVGKSFNLE